MIDTSKDLPASVMMESMKYLTSLIQNSINSYESTFASFNTNFPYPDFKQLFQSLDMFSYSEVSENPSKSQQNRNSNIATTPMHRRSNGGSSVSSRYTSPAPFRVSTPSLQTFPAEDILEQRKFVSKLYSSNAIKLS